MGTDGVPPQQGVQDSQWHCVVWIRTASARCHLFPPLFKVTWCLMFFQNHSGNPPLLWPFVTQHSQFFLQMTFNRAASNWRLHCYKMPLLSQCFLRLLDLEFAFATVTIGTNKNPFHKHSKCHVNSLCQYISQFLGINTKRNAQNLEQSTQKMNRQKFDLVRFYFSTYFWQIWIHFMLLFI